LSPYGVASDMQHYPEIDATYKYLAEQLDKIGIAYIHIVDHSNMGAPKVPESIKKDIRERFHNTIILAGGYNKESAESALNKGLADLVAFGKPFINNPDLVDRMKNNWPLSAELDFKTFYSGNEKGYTDYAFYKL
jgi:N-ethylmaleimide reductase